MFKQQGFRHRTIRSSNFQVPAVTHAVVDEESDVQVKTCQIRRPGAKARRGFLAQHKENGFNNGLSTFLVRSHGNSRGVNSREVRGFFGHNS